MNRPKRKVIKMKILKLAAVSILLTAGMVAGCARQDDPVVWYGPATLNTVTRGVRDDFLDQFTNTNNWKTTYTEAGVFKQFIETLYPDNRPATGRPRYTDAELKRLAEFTKQTGLKCAFEFGALRWTPKRYGKGSGAAYAEEEIALLRRWEKAGGSIDYLTTDHAVMWNVGLCLQGAKPMAPYVKDPDWRKAADEVVESLVMIHKAFPKAKIGMIESLGYFYVPGADGKVYPTTSPANIYRIDFGEFVRTLKEKLASKGVALDHFHIDFSYQDCRYDGREEKRLDFGRIMAAEKIIKSLGLKSGIIINAFDDFSYRGGNMVQEKEKAQNAAERSASAVDNTLEYFDGYVAAGGNPDTWIFQRWQPYPDVTGPETERNTDMGVTRLLVNKLKQLKE